MENHSCNLPTVKLDREYFIDERLEELRAVDNPHHRISFYDLIQEHKDKIIRAVLEKDYPGDVYNTQELQAKFKVKSFCAPYVVVEGGTLQFIHMPRFYFNFKST